MQPNRNGHGQVVDVAPESGPGGLAFDRSFCPPGSDPYSTVEWTTRDAVIEKIKPDGTRHDFRQEGVEFPAEFSQSAVNVVAEKYFYGPQGKGDDPKTGGRERSFRQLVRRISQTIADWGFCDGVFRSDADAGAFLDDLAWLQLHQVLAFNSPVEFNCGLWHAYGATGTSDCYRWSPEDDAADKVADEEAYKYPQISACFIIGVVDDMESIADRGKQEMMLFKYGSGAGSDNSPLRSRRERLSGGGRPSGPVSFMQVYDAIAGVTKSGGKSRRAAKMEILRCDHPDIEDFIEAKSAEERKAHMLLDAGFSNDFDAGAYAQVKFQNSNMSVRATGNFMRKATGDNPNPTWQTIAVTTGTFANTHDEMMPAYSAGTLLDQIAAGTWFCGDPGMQFDDAIQHWHTSPNSGRINATNPCSEYVYLDDTSCNLASLNLMKFRTDKGGFDVVGFREAIRIAIVAQDILVDHASYPSSKIAENSHRFRPLGLGYTNLGALLMSLGLPYDSDEARSLCGAITAILHGQANLTSAELAAKVGPFEGYAANREPMLRVMGQHRAACIAGRKAAFELHGKDANNPVYGLWIDAEHIWDAVEREGAEHGFRNGQVTVLAPTGTISFMMDCDTTGIEPDIALVKYKNLAGGGVMKIANQTVGLALRTMRHADGSMYGETQIAVILDYIEKHDTIEGCEDLLAEDLPVFDCAFPPPGGGRSISWEGHLRMMAAAQPFISGAISKTINMPEDATVAEIKAAYVLGWRLGLKAVAIYRNNCKRMQPLNTKKADDVKMTNGHAYGIADDVVATMFSITPDERDVAVAGRDEALLKVAALEKRLAGLSGPYRKKLPKTRPSTTHHFDIDGHQGYFTVSFYPDTGLPGELFITMAKEGSTVGGLMDAIGVATSFLLQYGAPLEALVEKFAFTRFEPAGFTGDPDVPMAKSIVDYIFRWLGMKYVPGYREKMRPDEYEPDENSPARGEPVVTIAERAKAGVSANGNGAAKKEWAKPLALHAVLDNGQAVQLRRFQSDAPPCPNCGALTVRAGSCHRCLRCGTSLGCS